MCLAEVLASEETLLSEDAGTPALLSCLVSLTEGVVVRLRRSRALTVAADSLPFLSSAYSDHISLNACPPASTMVCSHLTLPLPLLSE